MTNRTMTRAILLAATCIASLGAGASGAVAQPPIVAPHYRLERGPAALPVRDDLAVVPGQHAQIWFAAGVFWTDYRGRWFTVERRRDLWRPMARSSVPAVLLRLTADDLALAQATVDRANRFAHWHQPVRKPSANIVILPTKPKPVPEDEAAMWREAHDKRHREIQAALRDTPRPSCLPGDVDR